ncbi:MAG: TerC family protein [Proteobacteria bacterium]|nr:TerC family protein [Pseudomonadota bacterium]
MIQLLSDPATWVSLLTLSALEIVLGIDNIVFLAILAGRLPAAEQARARRLGLLLALATRLLLLFAITWLMGLTRELFRVLGHPFSGRDLILGAGGLFLLAKATFEIHDKLEVQPTPEDGGEATRGRARFGLVLLQIALLDLVFSLDSVITAVGMAQHLAVMIAAMVIAVGVMLVFAEGVSTFVERHPTMKMLALAFLLLIGVMLLAEATGRHVERGYIYFAMAFSFVVELLNIRVRRTQPSPLALPDSPVEQPQARRPSLSE